MKCPVCPNVGIAAGGTSCNNCGADLSPVRRVQELPARLYNEALVLLRGGEIEAAISKLQAALALGGDAPYVRRVLGKALWNAARYSEAVVHWRLAGDDEEAKRCLDMATASPIMKSPSHAREVAAEVVSPLALLPDARRATVALLVVVVALSFAAGAVVTILLHSGAEPTASQPVSRR